MKTRMTELLGIRYPIMQGGMQLEQSCRSVRTRMTPENCRQVPVLYGYMRAKLSE